MGRKKIEILKLKPSDREKYPNWKSKTELKKMGLMPKPNIEPRAVVVRPMYGNYELYDMAIPFTMPFKKTDAEKKIEKERRGKLKKLYSCPKCKEYIGVNRSWELEVYCGVCGSCFNKHRALYNEEVAKATLERPAVPCDNPTNGIVFDVETTGMNDSAELLQITIMDLNGVVLLNTYVKPYYTYNWDDAKRVHGISADMVADAPYAFELIPVLKGIFSDVEEIVGYNVDFDLGFIRELGINIPDCKISDVMMDFAPLYGQWNGYHQSYTWKSLVVCASYFEFKFKAHDAYEDVLATLHCYKKIKELMENGQYAEIVARNDDFVANAPFY